MVDSALEVLENEQATLSDQLAAIEALAYFVEGETDKVVYLSAGKTTDRIRNVCIRLLDIESLELPASALLWMLGKVDDPSLEPHYKRWLRRFVPRLKSTNAGIHQALINLDRLTGNARSASRMDVEENIKRAQSYVDEAFPR